MNTTEIKIKGKIKSFDDLYKYAMKQFLEYEKLEGIENWKEYDFSIDCSEDQIRFKDMLQIRCIEELTEATHALDNEEHFFEEITDALNFFLSAYCMLGVDFKKYEDPAKIIESGKRSSLYYNIEKEIKEQKYMEQVKLTLYYNFYNIVHHIGNLCNLLKNRPWTQSNYLVSIFDFENRLIDLWTIFWKTIGLLGLYPERIFELFERKYEVNKFRINTCY